VTFALCCLWIHGCRRGARKGRYKWIRGGINGMRQERKENGADTEVQAKAGNIGVMRDGRMRGRGSRRSQRAIRLVLRSWEDDDNRRGPAAVGGAARCCPGSESRAEYALDSSFWSQEILGLRLILRAPAAAIEISRHRSRLTPSLPAPPGVGGD
jgi:hypothetical protein